MTLDRAELAGTGIALAFHVALVAALSLHLAKVDAPPEPPSMEVELVDDIGLTASAPMAFAAPPPPNQAPEIGQAEPIEPTPAPSLEPAPRLPSIIPTPAPPRPALAAKPSPPARRTEARPAPASAPARPAPRATRIGDDFLKGIGPDKPSAVPGPRASAATFGATAKADVASAIAAQIRPCALRQRALGDGANRIRIKLSIKLARNGQLRGPPTVISVTGDDDDNSQFKELVKDQAIASYRQCAPLRLPADLYQTPTGGWSNIVVNYKVP